MGKVWPRSNHGNITAKVLTTTGKNDGKCGSNAQNYASSVTAWPSTSETAFCSEGTAYPTNPVFPEQVKSQKWTCKGSNGGTDSETCEAKREKSQSTLTGKGGVCLSER